MQRRQKGCPTFLSLAALVVVTSTAQGEKIPQGREFQVSRYTVDGQRRSAICSDGAGNFVAVWEDENDLDGSDDAVLGQRFDQAGNRLGTEFQANTYTFGDQGYVDICCADSGSFVVVWQSEEDQDGSGYGVFGQRYDSVGMRVGTEFQANSHTPNDQYGQKVCCDAVGNFVVTWQSQDQDGDGYGVFAQRYRSDGVPAGTEFQVNTYTVDGQSESDVCCADDGSFVVAWAGAGPAEGDGNGSGVFSRRFDSLGTPLGIEFLVNTYTTGDQDEPSICCDDPGAFVIVWSDNRQDGNGDGVFGQRFDSDGAAQGTEFQVNSYTSSPQADPDVCCDSLGNFVVAWESYQDGEEDGVFCRKFDANGAPLGNETQVNTYTVDGQFDPAVACDDNQGFVVVWTSLDQDGNNFGIFGQRFGRFGVGARSVPILSWIGLFVLSALLVVGGVRKARRRRA